MKIFIIDKQVLVIPCYCKLCEASILFVFSCIFQTDYNVVFFDTVEVTRAWIPVDRMLPYHSNKAKISNLIKENKKYKSRITFAMNQASEADKLPLVDRLNKFSFIARYKGNISTPKKISKQKLHAYKNKFQRKFNINLDDDFDNSNEEDNAPPLTKDINNNKKRTSDTENNKTRNNEGNLNKIIGVLARHGTEQETINTVVECQQNKDLTTQTQESFRACIPSPSSDDFDF